jgi:lipopolysaccharide biosynthesis regulator YciM
VIEYYYNPEKTYSETSYLFCEIASLFPEMVALFNNIGNRDKLSTNYELYCLLVTYYEISNALLLHQVIINKWKECNHKTNLKFYYSLKRDFNLSYSDIYEFLSHNLVNSGSYVLSFEACAELLYIYFVEDDKERALDIYKKILKADKNEDELFVILSELELGKNLNNIARMILMNFIKSIKEYEKNENMGLRLSR